MPNLESLGVTETRLAPVSTAVVNNTISSSSSSSRSSNVRVGGGVLHTRAVAAEVRGHQVPWSYRQSCAACCGCWEPAS